jgi:tRNA (guanine37-N1)-methyltransferase
LIKTRCWNPRDYSDNKHRRVDDRPYGGGPGMVMMVKPLQGAIIAARKAEKGKAILVHLSPQGEVLTQKKLEKITARRKKPRFIFLSGRYEGIDERLIEAEVDEEWSIGDYILSGGELAVMVIIDAITRLLPGALGDPESADQDSFGHGLLDHTHYTRPEIIGEKAVPEVLLGGDHRAIARWRLKTAIGRTYLRRPDLLTRRKLTKTEKLLLNEFLKENKIEGKR